MSSGPDTGSGENTGGVMGWIRNNPRRVRIGAALLALVAITGWLYSYLRPDTWHYYTDETSVRRLAKDVDPRYVTWADAVPAAGDAVIPSEAYESAISPDGARMVYTRGHKDGDANLYMAVWNGSSWSEGKPLRALNSAFHETGPAFSSDGKFLYFASDRPGGPGGYDIWVSRFDGQHFAWPLPLTGMINSPFDDMGPAVAPQHDKLYFASRRPNRELTEEESQMSATELQERFRHLDFDIFAANRIPEGVTNRVVERAMSMLYYLRESALADEETMRLLGGSRETEAAVDKGLKWLAAAQHEEGYWSISDHGGKKGHDMGATGFALLAFLGRGETHTGDSQYAETVRKALDWMIKNQKPLGDLRTRGGNMYDHSIGTLALAEAYGVTKDQDWLYEPAQAAVDFLVDSQNEKTGGWRYSPGQEADLSVSGWGIMALKSAELSGVIVPFTAYEGVHKLLNSVSTGKNGGMYAYTPGSGARGAAMAATGYFCSQLMGLSPNTLRSFETSDYMRKQGVNVGDLYYAYYGTLAAYQGQGEAWQEWKKKLHSEFVRTQQPDGSWNPTGGGHGNSMGKVVTSAIIALSLQAHYRYTPLYGLGYDAQNDPDAVSDYDLNALPEVPLYRRAKLMVPLSSPKDDVEVALTSHGDLLYLASDRAGGEGGLDLYCYRISGESIGPAVSLGPAINTSSDETSPATRMAGFNLLFSSDREAEEYALYQAMSRQVYPRNEFGNTPTLSFMWDHYRNRLLLLVAAVLGLVWSVRFCMRPAGRESHV